MGARVENLEAALTQFIPHVMRVTDTPGLSVAVMRGGTIVHEEGYGFADLFARVPMSRSSISPLGSITKLYTAIATLQLIEGGILELYGPVREYVGPIAVSNPLGERQITLYDLLTFRSGLADEALDSDGIIPHSLEDYLTDAFSAARRPEYRSKDSRWTAKVGERFQYSSLGIATLGHIVARMNPEGLSYPAYVQRHIFQPLGMQSSFMRTAEEDSDRVCELEPRLSVGYGRFGDVCVPTPPLYPLGTPAAGMCATAGDHVRTVSALLNGGEHEGGKILSPATVAMMHTPQTEAGSLPDSGALWHGLGVQVRLNEQGGYFGHLGALPWGWYHDSRGYPNSDLAVVVLTNRFDVSRWDNPVRDIAPGIICDFISSLVEESEPPPGTRYSWEYKEGYMSGLLLAERTNGMLGVPTRLESSVAAELAGRAWSVSGDTPVQSDWIEGFIAAVGEMRRVPISSAAIQAHIESGRLPVTKAEQRLVALHFGRRGVLPVPHRFFAPHA